MAGSGANLDGLLLQWGDRLFYEPVRGRRAPRVHRGFWPGSASALRAQIARTVRRVPEVMVKITNRPGTRNGMGAIRAHLDYISRHGEVELEDQDGQTLNGRDEVRDLVQMWRFAGRGIPEESTCREAFNVMLSMPPGTDRAAVKAAARAFAQGEFEGHEYVFAAHDDEAHPHVHLVVLARSRHGQRLNPRKADLQCWRERFAHELRERGIEANATPRRTRGVTQPTEPQSLRHRRERSGAAHDRLVSRPDAQAAFDSALPTLSGWRAMASTLAKSPDVGDQHMAKGIAEFVAGMPVMTDALPSWRPGTKLISRSDIPKQSLPDSPEKDLPDIGKWRDDWPMRR
jgi:hypothetical protein